MPKKLLLVILAASLTLILGLSYPSLALNYLVDPLAKVIWVLRRIFLTVNQEVYWILLVLVALIVVVLLIPEDRFTSLQPGSHERQSKPDRIQYWREIYLSGVGGKAGRRILARSLGQLVRKLSPGAEQGGAAEKSLLPDPMPPEVVAILQDAGEIEENAFGSAELPPMPSPRWLRIAGWYLNRSERSRLITILHWLEVKLEITDEDSPSGYHD